MPRLCRAMARVRAVDLRRHRKNNAKRVKVFDLLSSRFGQSLNASHRDAATFFKKLAVGKAEPYGLDLKAKHSFAKKKKPAMPPICLRQRAEASPDGFHAAFRVLMVLPGRAFALCASRRAGGGATFLSAKLRFAVKTVGRCPTPCKPFEKGLTENFYAASRFSFSPFSAIIN